MPCPATVVRISSTSLFPVKLSSAAGKTCTMTSKSRSQWLDYDIGTQNALIYIVYCNN